MCVLQSVASCKLQAACSNSVALGATVNFHCKILAMWLYSGLIHSRPVAQLPGPGQIKCCAVGMLIYRVARVDYRVHEHVESPHPVVVVVAVVACPPFGIWHFLIAQMHPRSTKQQSHLSWSLPQRWPGMSGWGGWRLQRLRRLRCMWALIFVICVQLSTQAKPQAGTAAEAEAGAGAAA